MSKHSDAFILSQGIEELWERAEARRTHRTEKERFYTEGGHCACDVHGDPSCDACVERRKLLRAQPKCACGRLLMRKTDTQCPYCDPGLIAEPQWSKDFTANGGWKGCK